MSRIKKSKNETFKHLPIIDDEKEYGLSDLNWEDSGGTIDEYSLTDPSMKDYLKGYQMEPYQFTQWANKNVLHHVQKGETLGSITKKYYGHESFKKEIVKLNSSLTNKDFRSGMMLIVGVEPNVKEAAKEVIDISYTPENLAKEILTLWSQADGPLQNFYEGFTVNKTTNEMKQKIADILKEWGYDVTPVLVDETPRYARLAAFANLMKGAKMKDMREASNYFSQMFKTSKVLQKVAEEIKELEEEQGVKVAKDDMQGLIDYYKQIFPDDYATSLVNITLDKPNMEFEEFEDIQISDEALEQMEKMDKGEQTPMSKNPNNGGQGGYDFTTHMRSDDPGAGGVAPNMYETRASRIRGHLKKK